MSELSFPKSGYHSEYDTTNNRSIFEFVEKDKMYTVNFPEEVSPTGRVMIGDVVDNWLKNQSALTEETRFPSGIDMPTFGWAGVITKKTEEIPFQGSFVKRVMSYYHKTFGINIPNEVASKIGNLSGKDVSGDTFHFKFDPIANYTAGAFGDEGSCYWTDRQGARILIRNEGGSFVTFFDSPDGFIDGYGDVSNGNGMGRAWILPIDQWTFYPDSPLFLLCNVYVNSGINKYNATRAVSTLLGMTYRYCSRVDSNLNVLYINGDVGFVIGESLEQVTKTAESGINMNYSVKYDRVGYDPELDWGRHEDDHEDEEYCENCGEYVQAEEYIYDLNLCFDCATRSHIRCRRCGDWVSRDYAIYVDYEDYCQDCAELLNIRYCDCCEDTQRNTHYRDEVGEDVCDDCWDSYYAKCEECGQVYHINDLLEGDICDDCYNTQKEEEQSEQNQDRLQ